MNATATKLFRRSTLIAALAGLGLAFGVGQAQAGFALSISDGTNSVDCTDHVGVGPGSTCTVTGAGFGIGDNDPLANAMSGAAIAVGNWSSISFLANTHNSGIPNLMWINSASTTTVALTSTETLTISLTQTGFSSAAATNFLSTFIDGGQVAGGLTGVGHSLNYDLWIDDSNAEFGMGQLIGSSGPLEGTLAPNDNVFGGSGTTTGTYSITQVFSITHAASAGSLSTSFTSAVTTPEPSVLALIAGGLMLAGVARRRKA